MHMCNDVMCSHEMKIKAKHSGFKVVNMIKTLEFGKSFFFIQNSCVVIGSIIAEVDKQSIHWLY